MIEYDLPMEWVEERDETMVCYCRIGPPYCQGCPKIKVKIVLPELELESRICNSCSGKGLLHGKMFTTYCDICNGYGTTNRRSVVKPNS